MKPNPSKLLLAVLLTAVTAWGQTIPVAPHGDISIVPPATTGTLEFRNVQIPEPLLTCRIANEGTPIGCVITKGHTLDEVVGVMMKQMKSDADRNNEERKDLLNHLDAILKVAEDCVMSHRTPAHKSTAPPAVQKKESHVEAR